MLSRNPLYAFGLFLLTLNLGVISSANCVEEPIDLQTKLEAIATAHVQGIVAAGNNPIRRRDAMAGVIPKLKPLNEKLTFPGLKAKVENIREFKKGYYVTLKSTSKDSVFYSLDIVIPQTGDEAMRKVYLQEYEALRNSVGLLNTGDTVSFTAYINDIRTRILNKDASEFSGKLISVVKIEAPVELKPTP